MQRLHEKVALVTGAGRGIGQAIVEVFVAQGAVVVPTGIAGTATTLDVTRQTDWERVVRETVETHGSIDILINKAGIVASYAQIHETALEQWEKVIAVNQTGTFPDMRTVLPYMLSQGIKRHPELGSPAICVAHPQSM